MPQQCRGEEAMQVSWLEPSEGEDRAGLRGFPLSKWFMMQGGLHSSVRLGPERDTQLQPAPILSSQKKGKTKTHQCMIQPQFEKQGHWHSLVKPRLKTYPRMHDLPKICQPLQCSNFLHDHSHMKNEMKPHGNLWHFYYYAMFGWKKKLLKFSFPSRVSLEKLFLAFLNYTFHH